MIKLSSWKSFYQVLPDGRSTISRARLADLPADRILDTILAGQKTKTLLLDKPFRLGPRVKEPGETAYFLTKIHLRDLVGWPPRVAASGIQPRFPGALRCSLKSVTFKSDRVEFELECAGGSFRAWQMECPTRLLRCVEATLNQDGTKGKKLADLQELRLIGVD